MRQLSRYWQMSGQIHSARWTMPTSEPKPPVDYPALLPEMIAAIGKDGLDETFAKETGVFLATLFQFSGQVGDKLNAPAMGAMACVMPLHKLYSQDQWEETLKY